MMRKIIYVLIMDDQEFRGDDILEIKKQFVVDDKNRKIAVQIDIDTFREIEDLLENHILAQLMKESAHDRSYNVENAKAYYHSYKRSST